MQSRAVAKYVRVSPRKADAVLALIRGLEVSRAQELLALVSDHPQGLAGVFPGSPHAFTAMLARCHEGQFHWRTWHAYPQDGQLVATRTRVGARVTARTGAVRA